jgi:hypothetical protein
MQASVVVGVDADVRRHAPATLRNRDPILEVLRRVLPEGGLVLEVASGTGEHAAYFSRHMPHLQWQPSDADPTALPSIASWSAESDVPRASPVAPGISPGVSNVRAPIQLDVRQPLGAAGDLLDGLGAIVNINMIHIAPWAACEGLMQLAESRLPPTGILFLYGPFRRGGQHTAPSNARFDAGLREQNREWGVRDLDDVVHLAADHGLDHTETVAMPANNLSIVFCRRTDG